LPLDRFFFICSYCIILDDPVTVNSDGVKLKPEKMIINQLYHCIFENKVFLFYKDEDELLHCYEVEDPDAVKEISANPADLETILTKYSHNM
jgi:hypothetical protein